MSTFIFSDDLSFIERKQALEARGVATDNLADCPHCSITTEGCSCCALNLYGGHPLTGNCLDCIRSGQNNKAFADKLAARYAKSHPEGWRNTGTVSNCCGRADQD